MTARSYRLAGLGVAALAALVAPAVAANDLKAELKPAIDAVHSRVVDWRRDIHRHPELLNREERTAAMVAAHLRNLGLEVRTGIAHHDLFANPTRK